MIVISIMLMFMIGCENEEVEDSAEEEVEEQEVYIRYH